MNVGDGVDVNLGYTDSHGIVFSGYVKRVEKANPEGWTTIVANDVLVRAIDFFIVSNNPEHGFTYRGITAEDLIAEVLGMAGLSSFNFENTFFTFGINNDVEVNLVSSYDYSRMISDIIAWSFWADKNGTIYLRNRKPYVMEAGSEEESQPGFHADSSIGEIVDADIITFNASMNEKDLRNKIVVYGLDNMVASAQRATSYNPLTGNYEQILPSGFYKAAVLASSLIDDHGFAQKAADYNLALLNRVSWEAILTIEGRYDLEARKVVTINSTDFSDYNGDWYIYQLEHSLSKGGYVTNLVLRK